MSFNKLYQENNRNQQFLFYQSYGVNGAIADNVNPGGKGWWKLAEIRVHFSTAFVSDNALTIKLSSILGSAHDITLYSVNVSGSTDIFIYYSYPLLFQSDDNILISLATKSGLNVIGFTFIGWAVIN